MGALLQFIVASGADLMILASIIVGTFWIRIGLKIQGKKVLLIPLILGLIAGITQIILFNIEFVYWLRIIAGYPSVSMLLYMLFRKYFPDKEFLKPKK